MYWMAARLTSPDCALKAMPQNWSMPHSCDKRKTRTETKHCLIILLGLRVFWYEKFFLPLDSITNNTIFSTACTVITADTNYYKTLNFSETFSKSTTWGELVEIQNNEFSFLTNRNTFKWSHKNHNFNQYSLQRKKMPQINSENIF